jgi:hypothetical protein
MWPALVGVVVLYGLEVVVDVVVVESESSGLSSVEATVTGGPVSSLVCTLGTV